MDSSKSLELVIAAVVVIILVILMGIIIPRYVFKTVEPIDEGITNESVGLNQRIYMFREDLFKEEHPLYPFLLFAQLETYSVFHDAKPKLGQVEQAKLEKLKSKEVFVYKSFKLEFTHDNDKIIPVNSIENILMTFKVDKSWMNSPDKDKPDVKLGKDDIAFYSWDGADWKEYTADVLREEKDSYICQVGTKASDSFAIVGIG